MNRVKIRDSQSLPRHVRPYAGRSSAAIERRGPRPWSRDQRLAFLHQLSVQDTLEQALLAVHVLRVEALAERVRNKGFARAWDRCVADRMARLPELLLDHVFEGLRGGPEAREATVRQAASIGQWLLEKCLPALDGSKAPARAARSSVLPAKAQAPTSDDSGADRKLAEKVEAVRLRLAKHAALPRDGHQPAQADE